jgi:hypothetical protein
MSRYDDIIHLPHHQSETRPRMSRWDRAAQFSPFAALTGHGAAIREAARLTHPQMELDEDEKAALDEKLRVLVEQIDQHPEVTITYFQPDERKDGGAYVTVTGTLKKVDAVERTIVFLDGTSIGISAVVDIITPSGTRDHLPSI